MSDAKRLVEKKKNYHHGDLRGQLLEAVRQLVEEHGPDGFSIAEACRRAGVSTAAPYKHFSDRGEIMRGVVRMGMGRLRTAMEAAAAAHPADSPDRVAALGHAYIDFAHSEPSVFRMIFSLTEGHGQDEELSREGRETEAILEGVVADFLGIDPQSDEARLRSYALWCFVHGHSFLSLDGKVAHEDGPVDVARLLDVVGRAMLTRR